MDLFYMGFYLDSFLFAGDFWVAEDCQVLEDKFGEIQGSDLDHWVCIMAGVQW